MPIYDYRCRSCGTVVEVVHAMGGAPPKTCDQCGGELRRVYGRVAVRFSGWGFGSTDRLAPEGRPKKDFRTLKEKAEEIADS